LYENGVRELDDEKEKPKKEKTKDEKEAAKCPKCSAIWPRGSDVCLNCGHTRERKSMAVEVPGEMEELAATATRDDKQRFWSMCYHKIVVAGWSRGRAAHLYRDKWGVWPKGLQDIPITPDFKFEKFVKSRIIAFLKGKKSA
jgi:hypothetical protein